MRPEPTYGLPIPLLPVRLPPLDEFRSGLFDPGRPTTPTTLDRLLRHRRDGLRWPVGLPLERLGNSFLGLSSGITLRIQRDPNRLECLFNTLLVRPKTLC